ncbi:unnamed protein product, partial [Mesorhabditis belari]|uniref:Agrin n=1 Tax=Mesorhabditis belari TaxID=2138241 RepID=A0AAF3EWB7_9BILA
MLTVNRLFSIFFFTVFFLCVKSERRCGYVNRKSVNSTFDEAEILITATVREIHLDFETAKPQEARLFVRRVFKGKALLEGREEIYVKIDEQLVDGKRHCRRRWGAGDTKIFAISVEKKRFHSKIAPLPVTLSILDALHSIVTLLCEQKSCPFGSKCVPATGECECRTSCRDRAQPVCGSDHVTYASLCHLAVRACLLKKKDLMLRIERTGACEKKNPCDDLRCGPGEDCVIEQKNDVLSAHCVCPLHCPNFGDSVESSPVCSVQGRDYKSICHLKQDACETKLNITVKYYGKCDPCDGHLCAAGTTCKVGVHRRAECRCSQQCPLNREPVCGTDGNTYENECVMKVAACREDRTITVWKKGTCKDSGNPCAALSCPPGSRCSLSPSGAPKCECDASCPQIVKPVCASDGITYTSECEMRKSSCEAKRRVYVRHTGNCGVGVCSTFTGCRAPQVCVPKGDRPKCVCPECGDELKEVCGSDGQTYANECRLRQFACLSAQHVFVKYNGICEGCEKLRDKCEFYSVCVSDGKGAGKCECPVECPLNNTSTDKDTSGAVCGTDGVTYSSECHLRRSACQRRKFVVVAFFGKCDACQNVECGYGEECRGGVCTCNYHCPSDPPPASRVCGEDGILYGSSCHLQLAACQKGAPILTVDAALCHAQKQVVKVLTRSCSRETCGFGGVCSSLSKSHSSIECLCLHQCSGTLLIPVCGSDGVLYRNQCHLNLESCRFQREILAQPHIGSCSRENGCNCNRVGSYGPACDASGQCRCRPGVGGTKCDHCVPSFWGIHLIAKGALSCAPCGCSAFGSARPDCEQSTGRCECLTNAEGEKCEKCRDGFLLTAQGCVRPHDFQAPRTCSEHRCLHGARCVHARGELPSCACEMGCDEAKFGIATNMSVCGSDGQTYEGLCQLRLFACKHQIDLVPVSLGICDSEFSNAPSLDRSQRQKSPMLERQPEIVTLGSFCTFKTECASISADCMTRAGKKGRCQCGNGTIWNGKTCVEETIALLPLNLQFDGKQTAKLKRVDELPTNFNFTIQFSAAASNGALLDVLMVNGERLQMRIDQRRILLQ